MRISVEEIEQVFHHLIERIKQDEIEFKETLFNVVTASAVKIFALSGKPLTTK